MACLERMLGVVVVAENDKISNLLEAYITEPLQPWDSRDRLTA